MFHRGWGKNVSFLVLNESWKHVIYRHLCFGQINAGPYWTNLNQTKTVIGSNLVQTRNQRQWRLKSRPDYTAPNLNQTDIMIGSDFVQTGPKTNVCGTQGTSRLHTKKRHRYLSMLTEAYSVAWNVILWMPICGKPTTCKTSPKEVFGKDQKQKKDSCFLGCRSTPITFLKTRQLNRCISVFPVMWNP
jgi:hypothetical protein